MNKSMSVSEKYLFLSKFLRFPKQIGSVTPSSKTLAKKMVSSIPWGTVRHVVELGAGTGAITHFIQEEVHSSGKVFVFEKDPTLRQLLKEQYSEYNFFADAIQLDEAIRSKGIEQIDCVISGLPFANFPQQLRDGIMEQVVQTLKPGGWFVAFQYSLQMKKQLEQHFSIIRIHYVMANFPPAFVYVCQKK
ncbi:Phospholipid N-methyltransferase [Paenibacillus algorifonticola]|uniref:Phospholipid N-methyltransferase n=1 Tax=Paenibacillus algorifonticola TaxID=684063 RepID=A0A1I2J2G9_9BACL|nr:methyltransferase domain-containing protein [Paenibacillus algorifonticola]SFF46931.1 Phospholipid N-methyltransferase [Paenibacillus algorifonticola]